MFNCFLLSLFWGLDGPVMIGTELFLLTGHQSQQRAVGHGTRMSGGLGRVLSCTSLAEVGCKVCLQGLEPNLSASVKPKPHARALKMDRGGGGVSQDLSVPFPVWLHRVQKTENSFCYFLSLKLVHEDKIWLVSVVSSQVLVLTTALMRRSQQLPLHRDHDLKDAQVTG